MLRSEREANLSAETRGVLERFTSTGVRSVRLLKRAKIILALDVSGGMKPEKEETIGQKSVVT